MVNIKLNLIAAACENMGIGVNGNLPWRLKQEMAYFSRMTSTVQDQDKKNAVIMGRVTWDCIPPKYKPLSNRINIVLTRDSEKLKGNVPSGVVVCGDLDEAIKYVEDQKDIEKVWVIGGSSIYKSSMDHPNCGKIYLTEIKKSFNCDTFFPELDSRFQLLESHVDEDSSVPTERQVEGDLEYYYRIYKKIDSLQ